MALVGESGLAEDPAVMFKGRQRVTATGGQWTETGQRQQPRDSRHVWSKVARFCVEK